jgi:hypothetical protein
MSHAAKDETEAVADADADAVAVPQMNATHVERVHEYDESGNVRRTFTRIVLGNESAAALQRCVEASRNATSEQLDAAARVRAEAHALIAQLMYAEDYGGGGNDDDEEDSDYGDADDDATNAADAAVEAVAVATAAFSASVVHADGSAIAPMQTFESVPDTARLIFDAVDNDRCEY